MPIKRVINYSCLSCFTHNMQRHPDVMPKHQIKVVNPNLIMVPLSPITYTSAQLQEIATLIVYSVISLRQAQQPLMKMRMTSGKSHNILTPAYCRAYLNNTTHIIHNVKNNFLQLTLKVSIKIVEIT